MRLGENIYLWRSHQGLTQEALASMTGISRPNLSAIERGGRDLTVSTLGRIASALKVKPGQLLDGVVPGQCSAAVWNRERLDRIAQALIGRKIALNADESKAVALLKPILTQKLAPLKPLKKSLGRNAKNERLCLIRIKAMLGSENFRNILQRVEKMARVSL